MCVSHRKTVNSKQERCEFVLSSGSSINEWQPLEKLMKISKAVLDYDFILYLEPHPKPAYAEKLALPKPVADSLPTI